MSAETPQQPELTLEDRQRIDAWIKPRILTATHCATDWEFAQQAAEYATLHERAAAQARFDKDEDYKQAQARIRQLEADVLDRDQVIIKQLGLISDLVKSDLCGEIYDGGSVVGTKELEAAKNFIK